VIFGASVCCRGDCTYLVHAGKVGVYTTLLEEHDETAPDQELLHLATLKEGDFFGEQVLLTNDPRNATVVALTAVDLLHFSKPDLEAIMRTYPRIGDMLQHYHQQRNPRTIASLTSVLQPTEAEGKPIR
jgi:CRP-like cAMP-binding protein